MTTLTPRKQGFCVLYLPLYFQHLDHCRAHNRHSINICPMDGFNKIGKISQELVAEGFDAMLRNLEFGL